MAANNELSTAKVSGNQNGQAVITTTTTNNSELQLTHLPSPPQITQRHNSIFCFDNAAYKYDDEDEDSEEDFEIYEDAETVRAGREGEDEEYAFEPELRFKIQKRSSSLVTFFRNFNPGRKTVIISDPENREVDSRRKSSTKMPPRSPPPLPILQKLSSEPLNQNPSPEPLKPSKIETKKDTEYIPPPVPFKEPKRWIPFFSLFRYATRWDRLLIAFGFVITFLATWPIPALNLIYGQVVNNLVHYEGNYYHQKNNSTSSLKNFGAHSRGRLVLMDDFCDGKVEHKDYYLSPQENSQTPSEIFDTTSYEHDYLLCQVYFLSGTLMIIAAWYVFACYLSMLCFELAAFKISLGIRRLLFRSLLRQDIAWFDEQQTYDVMKKSSEKSAEVLSQNGIQRDSKSKQVKNTEFSTRVAKDLKAIEGGMNENLSMLLYFGFSCLWHASFALYCGWKLALAIFLTSAPIIAIATGVMSKFNTSAARKEMKAYGEAGAVANEMFSAVRTVFAFGGERRALELYDARLTPAVRSETRRSVVNSLGNALIWAGIYFGFAVGIWYGVRLMTDHGSSSDESEVSIGTIIVVFWCSAAVGWNAGSAAPYYEHILKACVVAKTVYETIESRPKINPTFSSTILKKRKKKHKKSRRSSGSGSKRHILPRTYTPSIEFRNVTFTYPSRRQKLLKLTLNELQNSSTLETIINPTLDCFNLTISAGEVVALVGPSGAGKSTVIQLLLRFYDPDKGQILLDGVDIRLLDVGWLREQMGVVGQEPVLFDASVGDNIRLGAASGRLMSVTEAEVMAAAREANAHEFIMRLPEGYNTMVGARGAKLSGGQKQRIAIARALLKNPAILLLDEATSALDLRSEAIVQAALDRAASGRTTLIVAHRLSTIAKADRIVVLDEGGRILEMGSHEQLMGSAEGHFRDLVMRQMTNSSPSDSQEVRNIVFDKRVLGFKKMGVLENEILPEEKEEIKEEITQKVVNSEDGFVDIPLRTLSMNRGQKIKNRISGWILPTSLSQPSTSHLSSKYSTFKVCLRILGLLFQSRTAVSLGVTCAVLFGLCVPIYAFIFGNFVNVFTNRSEVEVNSSFITTLSPLLLPEIAKPSEVFLDSLEEKKENEPSKNIIYSENSKRVSTTFGLDNDYLREQAQNYAFQFLGLAFFAFLSSFLQNSFFHIASQRLVTALRLLAFNSMLAKPVCWHERPENGAGRLCTTLANDPSDIQSSTGPRIAMLCQAGAALVVAVGFGLWTCWSLSLVALAFVPLIAYSSSSRVELFGEQNTKEGERNKEAAAVGAEAMANIRTVASLHREAFFERYYANLLDRNVREVHCSIHKKSLHAAWALGCPLVAYATVFLYGGHLVANHDLSSGDFFRVIEAMIFGAIVFGQACFFSSDFAKAKAAAIALFQLIDSKNEPETSSLKQPPSFPPPPSSTSLSPPSLSPPLSSGMTLHLQYGRARGEISFRRVTFSYPSRPSVTVLREVTFTVSAGQKVALVGSSGCGKTTILQLLERFYEPTDGLILLDGVSIANLSTSWLRAQMALVAQEPTLFNTTIRENIAYGDTSRQAIPRVEIEEAAKKAAIHEWITSLPNGYETVVGVGGCQLSGGQKQRIAIARTWIRNPPILLLDEATSALDSNSEKQIQSTLEAALVGRTVITIAHRFSTIANADLILYLHQGAIVESGSHEELLAKREHYWGLFNAQKDLGSSRTSKVDLVALSTERDDEEKIKEEKINVVEREFRV